MKKSLNPVFFLLTLIALLINTNNVFAQAAKKADNDTKNWRYELECVGTGNEGTYLIKVYSYSKKSKIAIAQAQKNAVHGVVFKGFGGGGRGCTSQRPLANSPAVEDEKADFFKAFFADGGKFMKYVSVSGDGTINSEDIMKVGKEYKIGIVVTVMKDQLRKDLEAAGVIKGLSSGF
jgi:hypothetical protein